MSRECFVVHVIEGLYHCKSLVIHHLRMLRGISIWFYFFPTTERENRSQIFRFFVIGIVCHIPKNPWDVMGCQTHLF